MAVGKGSVAARRAGQETPLLREQRVENGRSGRSTSQQIRDEEESLDPDRANQEVGKLRGLLIILSLWGLIFIQASNFSGITTTQSRIAEDLDAFAEATWFTSTYLIAMSSISPITARLATLFSPRYCIFGAAVLFSIGGIVTSKALSLEIFLLGRVISGSGGAGIMTIAFILLLELSGKKRRGLYIGLVNTGFTSGISLGAVIAGALLPIKGWRFLFWIQAPLAMIAGTALFFSIPSSFTSGQKFGESSIWAKLARIDYAGALLLMASLASFLFGMSSPKILWQPIVISLALVILFVVIEVFVASEPIIPVTLLSSRGTLLSCLAQLGLMSSRWMVLFYAPAYALAVRGWSPASAGSMLIPTNLGFAVGGITIGALHVNRGGSFWLPSVIAAFLFACSLFLISQAATPTMPVAWFIAAIFLNGFCTGAAINYALAHLLHLTPPSTHFIATALLNTFRGFAGSFGSAIGGGLFIRVLKDSLEKGFIENGGMEGREELVRKLVGSPALVQTLKGVEKLVAVNSYAEGISRLFVSGAVVGLLVVIIQATTGWKGSIVKEEEQRPLVNGDSGEDWEEGLEHGA